jgi:hypothetical protein
MWHVWGRREACTGWRNLRGRDHLGELARRWEDNIKMDLQEEGCEVTDWIELAEDKDR